MNKIVKSAISIILSVVFLSPSVLTVPVVAATDTAEEMISKISVGWNLGNTLDPIGDWIDKSSVKNFETAWGNPVTTPEMIKEIKKAGFNAVRVPVSYSRRMDADGNINKDWLDRVETVVGYVLAEDMYCIINIHHDTGVDGWIKANPAKYTETSVLFKKLWVQIANRFKNHSGRLMFEGFNEILDENNNWGVPSAAALEVVNKLNSLFVETVRASGGNNKTRNLVVNTYAASWGEEVLAGFVLPKDTVKNRLIVQVHVYEPQNFAGVWALTTNRWSGTESEKAALDLVFDRLKKYSGKWGAPVIVGEWGTADQGNDAERATHGAYFIKAAKERGIKCFYWDDGGDYRLFDRKELKFSAPELAKAITSAGNITSSAELTEPKVRLQRAGNRIKLSWATIPGAQKYYVYLYNSNKKLYSRISIVNGTNIIYSDLKAGEYKFRVLAVSDKKGPVSKAVKVTIK